MHASLFDTYLSITSPIHELDPRVKVVVTLLIILSNAILPDGAWLSFLFTWLLILALCMISKIKVSFLLKRSLLALPFALAAVTVTFNIPGELVLSLKVGPWILNLTDAGVIRFFSIMLRSWLSVQIAIILISTTQFPDLTHALRHLKVPIIIISIVSFMYRYLFVLSDETMRLLRARDARSARLPTKKGGGSLLWRSRVAGNMAGQLFLRSYERADRVYNAMLSRGYQGNLLTMSAHVMKRSDWIWLFISISIILIIQLVGTMNFL